jgi:hypothetical protein
MEGEVLDDEIIAAAGLEVVDEPHANTNKTKEQRLINAMGVNFQKLQDAN